MANPRTPRSRSAAVARFETESGLSPQAEAVLAKLRVLFASIRSHNRAILEQCGIGALQLRVLATVREMPDMGVSALAKALMIRQPSASRMVDELVSRGMLSRREHPTDGRATVLRLRKAGEQALARAPAPLRGLLPDALERMDAERLRRLDTALAQLLEDLHVTSVEARLEPLTDA